jgi:hypothetical protein|uniref:Uncharacterized protein n=1 Tax=viral metagenome TaxID=1070528 RepID=A0A6C0CXP9_9ZZZZ
MAAADPTVSIVFFLILTLAYSIFKYYTKSPKTIQLWTIIYFLILIVVQFFINVGLTKEICGFEQYGVALQQTIIPWVFVFGLLNILLMVFPNWLNPFSNTIGYLFASITGVNGFLKGILKDRKTLDLGPKQAEMITAINNVYDDKSLLINSMTTTNAPLWWESMKNGGLLKPGVGVEQFVQLEQYIKMKTIISEFIWFALTGMLVTSISYNNMVNSGCTQSAEEMQKRHNEYVENEKKIQEAQGQKEQIVYKSYD